MNLIRTNRNKLFTVVLALNWACSTGYVGTHQEIYCENEISLLRYNPRVNFGYEPPQISLKKYSNKTLLENELNRTIEPIINEFPHGTGHFLVPFSTKDRLQINAEENSFNIHFFSYIYEDYGYGMPPSYPENIVINTLNDSIRFENDLISYEELERIVTKHYLNFGKDFGFSPSPSKAYITIIVSDQLDMKEFETIVDHIVIGYLDAVNKYSLENFGVKLCNATDNIVEDIKSLFALKLELLFDSNRYVHE